MPLPLNSSRSMLSPGRRRSHVPSMEEMTKSLLEASSQGDRKKAKKMLLFGVNVDCPNEKGETALYLASIEGHEGLTELLLRHGANPNWRNFEGDTPVHAAANSGNARILNLLVNAGGDLRLHNRRGLTARDWAWKLADSKKRKNIIDIIEKRRSTALGQSGCDLQNLSIQSQPGSKSLTTLSLKRYKNKSLVGTSSVHSDGFGRICYEKGASVGAVATVPMISETSIRHDHYGYTYDNGPFMVMESMLWNKEPVTSKRLHKDPREGGNVDLLISELAYMSRLSHPSILLLMGTCRINNLDGLVLVYERVGLGSLFCGLYQKMETFSRVSMAVILQQTANALLYLHRQNLFHCYVSSHSIQLIRRDFAKLSNFEYVAEEGSRSYTSILENKYLNAAYNWLAPEILAGREPTDKSDLYGLCAVMWEIVHGQVPWHNVPADVIVQEMVERGHLLELSDHVEDPFNIMLQYGLSGRPDERRLSLEQMRDYLSEYIADCDRLKKIDELAETSPADLTPSERQERRHAHFSPEVEIVSSGSGEIAALSAEDISHALKSDFPDLGLNEQKIDANVITRKPSIENGMRTNDGKNLARTKIDDPIKTDDVERTYVKTVESKKQEFTILERDKLGAEFYQHPLKQSTPMTHRTSSPLKNDLAGDYYTMSTALGRDTCTAEKLKTDAIVGEQAYGVKESGSRVSFDFIQNPLKKAFFEGTVTSPPCSARSILSPRITTIDENRSMASGEKHDHRTQPTKGLQDPLRNLKIPLNDPFSLELQRETEEFIKTPSGKPNQLQASNARFMKHTYGYYANNIYRPKGGYDRPWATLNDTISPVNRGTLLNKIAPTKRTPSPAFGVSPRDLKAAATQAQDSLSGIKEDQATKNSESFSIGSMVSHPSQVSSCTVTANDGAEDQESSIDISGLLPGSEITRDRPEAGRLMVSKAAARQHLSFVTSRRLLPSYTTGFLSARPLVSLVEAGVTRDTLDDTDLSSSSTATKQSSKDDSKLLGQKIQTSASIGKKTSAEILGRAGKSNTLPRPKVAAIYKPFDGSGSQLTSQEKLFTRSVKPASHHEPCLLKPSKMGVPDSPQLESLAHEKDFLMTMTPPARPVRDKRIEMLKNDVEAMHRFKSDSVLQNKPDGTVQLRSSAQNPISAGMNTPEPGQEVNIKDLISTYQSKMEEHQRKQSILTLKRNRTCGGDSLSIASPAKNTQWPAMYMPNDATTQVALMNCMPEGDLKVDLGKSKSSSKTKIQGLESVLTNGKQSRNFCSHGAGTKSFSQASKVANDLCVSKLQLSLTSPAVAKVKLQSQDEATKQASDIVNRAIVNSHKQVVDRYVHPDCPHKETDLAALRGTSEKRGVARSQVGEGSSTKLSIRSSDTSVPSASFATPGFRSIAMNTSVKDHHDKATQNNQISPAESACSRISSTDIKEFYYDDDLHSPELTVEKHLRLQSAADFDTAENVQTNARPGCCPSMSYSSGVCDTSGNDGGDGQHNGKLENGSKNPKLIMLDHRKEPHLKLRGLSLSGNDSGPDTDTDSTVSSLTEALCVTKHINTSRNDGFSSSVTVESHAKGYHTITCNKLDPLTGNQSTTYRAKVKAPRVITKFILDDDDGGDDDDSSKRPYPV